MSRVYTPYKCHLPFFEDAISWKKQELFLFGALGSGKTSISIQVAFALSGLIPEYRVYATPKDRRGIRHTKILLVRNTQEQIRRNLCTSIVDLFPTIPELERLKVGNRAPYCKVERETDDGKIIVEIFSQALGDVDSEKALKGSEYTIAIVDEATTIREEHYDMIRARIGRFPSRASLPDNTEPLSLILCPTNTSSPSNWVKKQWEREKTIQTGLVGFYELPAPFLHTEGEVHLDAKGNPIYNPLAEEYIKSMPIGYYPKQRISSSSGFQRNILCRWVGNEGGAPVFHEFSSSRHVESGVLERRNKDELVWVGVDIGGNTIHPAAVFMQRIEGQVCVMYEEAPERGDSWSIQEFIRRLKQIASRYFSGYQLCWYADPSGNVANAAEEDLATAYDMFRREGIDMRRCPLSTRGIQAKLECLTVLLVTCIANKESIVFDREHCNELISALAGDYCYPNKGFDGRTESQPVKTHPTSDVVDALLYGLSSSGEFHATRRTTAMANKHMRSVMGFGSYNPTRELGDALRPSAFKKGITREVNVRNTFT